MLNTKLKVCFCLFFPFLYIRTIATTTTLMAHIHTQKCIPSQRSHNDLAWNIRKFLKNRLQDFPFAGNLREVLPWSASAWSHTDLPRLKEGMVSAQVCIKIEQK